MGGYCGLSLYRMDIDKPPTARFWLYVFAVAIAVALIVGIIWAINDSRKQDKERAPAEYSLCMQKKLGRSDWQNAPNDTFIPAMQACKAET